MCVLHVRVLQLGHLSQFGAQSSLPYLGSVWDTVRKGAGSTGLCLCYRNALQLFPITINLIRIMDRKCPFVANAVWHQLTEIL